MTPQHIPAVTRIAGARFDAQVAVDNTIVSPMHGWSLRHSFIEGWRQAEASRPANAPAHNLLTSQAQVLLEHAAALLREQHPEVAEQLSDVAGRSRLVPGGDEGDYYTCTGKGGLYEFLGRAKGAGTKRGSDDAFVYRDAQSGQLFYRCESDFTARMEMQSIAPVRAPAPTLVPGTAEVAQYFNSASIRFDRVSGRFILITEDHPVREGQASKDFVAKHRSRFLSAGTLKALLLMTQPADEVAA